jgi:spore germination protein KC
MRPFSRLFRLALSILFTLSFATGCWDYRELDKDRIVDSLAYDINENGSASVTAEIPNFRPESNANQGKSEETMEIVSANGLTFYEAIQNLTSVLPGTLTFSHHRVNIFSEEMTKSSLFPNVLDRLIRVGEIRRRTLFFMTSGRAEDIFKEKIHASKNIGEGLSGIADTSTEQQYSPKIDLNEFLYVLSTPGIDPLIPRIEIQQSGDSGADEIRVVGSGAFRKTQFVGWLSGNETRAVLWVKGESGHPTFSIKWNGDKIIVKTKEVHSRIIPISSTTPPGFKVKTEWSGDVSMYSGNKVIRFHDAPDIEKEVSEDIRKMIAESIQRSQSLGTDVFGFGNALYCQNPSFYKSHFWTNWDTNGFPDAKIEIEVQSTILGLGYSLTTPEKR